MTSYAMNKIEAKSTLYKVTGIEGRIRLSRQFRRDSVGLIEFVYGSAVGWSILPICGPNEEDGSYVYKLAKDKVKQTQTELEMNLMANKLTDEMAAKVRDVVAAT